MCEMCDRLGYHPRPSLMPFPGEGETIRMMMEGTYSGTISDGRAVFDIDVNNIKGMVAVPVEYFEPMIVPGIPEEPPTGAVVVVQTPNGDTKVYESKARLWLCLNSEEWGLTWSDVCKNRILSVTLPG